MKRLMALFAGSMLLILAAPGCEREVAEAPPEIRLGYDVCMHCNMIISDARHAAAALVRVEGKRKAVLFDDIGDLLDYRHANPDMKVEREYVHDHDTRQWIEFENARYVHAPEVHTPMGSGILAFAADSNAAGAAERYSGKQLSPGELRAFRRSRTADSTGACCDSKSGG